MLRTIESFANFNFKDGYVIGEKTTFNFLVFDNDNKYIGTIFSQNVEQAITVLLPEMEKLDKNLTLNEAFKEWEDGAGNAIDTDTDSDFRKRTEDYKNYYENVIFVNEP